MNTFWQCETNPSKINVTFFFHLVNSKYLYNAITSKRLVTYNIHVTYMPHTTHRA